MRPIPRRLLVLAGAAGAAAVLAGGALFAYFATHPPPAPFQIGSRATERPTAGAAASPAAGATPCTPAPGTAGYWAIQPGSEAGYRVQEKFIELPAPNDAVARTDTVAGFAVLAQTASGQPVLTAGCVAVDVSTLRSVDLLPPPLPPATGRDGHYREMLDTVNHPFVVFRAAGIQLPDRVLSGDTVSVQLPGELTLKGITRPVTAQAQVRVTGGQADVAGSLAVNAPDFGVQVPSDPARLVQPNVTLEFLLHLARP